MKNKRIIFAVFFSILMSSCSSMKKSLALGVGSGAVIGGVAGSSYGGKDGAVTGALTGALVSGIASYFIHGSLEKRDSNVRKDTLLNLEKFNVARPSGTALNGSNPAISKPVVDSFMVDEQVKGNKLIEAHRVWIIEENSQWLPRSQKSER